jgi:1-pyrroline-5-carboxylate dehydrogenase
MTRIYAEQPLSSPGVWNRMEYRPLEGFVLAVSPFNFTAIAGNLTSSAALMGNVVLWKPASTAMLSAYYLMRLWQEAGCRRRDQHAARLGSGDRRCCACEPRPCGHPLHGLDAVFNGMWKTVGENAGRYRNYPRVVGETGGKDFIVAHPSADVDALATAIVRGSFEYQGQKCSASSRVYAPSEPLPKLRERLQEEISTIKIGDVADFGNFMGAVIDDSSFRTQAAAIEEAKANAEADVVVGGGYDDSRGYFVEPTVIETRDPGFRTMREELFGPVVTTFVYDESKWPETLDLVDSTAPYGLTGAVFAEDRSAIQEAKDRLRYAAGTSTSTTSRPAPSSASSRSAARAPRGRTTRRARCGT